VTKYRSPRQVETALERAVNFARNVLGNDDLADDLESMTPEQYAEHRGLVITKQERKISMANGSTMTKSDLQDVCDQVQDILTDVYTPEASRAGLVDAVSSALDILAGDAGDDGDDDTDDADGDNDSD
jgi:hypothetical protein